jgi:hypothetical protein
VRAIPNKLFLVCLATLLSGYALCGRGFAYLGLPPVFVGEMVLGLAALVLCAAWLRRVWTAPLVWLLVLFMAWGAARTLPYVGEYGIDALRDGVQWAYGVYALAVAVALLRTGWIDRVPHWYAMLAALFLLWVLPALLLDRLAPQAIPRLPWGPGEGVPLLDTKGGDVAVHLAGILAFAALGLAGNRLRSAWWWVLWALAAGLLFVSGRAAMLTIAAVFAVIVLVRPFGRWRIAAGAMAAGIALLFATNVSISIGGERSLSPATLVAAVTSTFTSTDHAHFEGSRRWRLEWWSRIVGYTVHGEHFWGGKGYGVNLADADGFQVADGALRSPHNGHMTLLARGGVPSLALWVVLQLAFAAALLAAYRRHRRAGDHTPANLALWVLLYWMAFMINASFDVYLEGPHGGIWFWALFGFGLALLTRKPTPRRNDAYIADPQLLPAARW